MVQWPQSRLTFTETDADQTVTIVAEASTALTEFVAVAFSRTGGTTASADVTLPPSPLNVSGSTGQTSLGFQMTIKGDNIAEPAETLELTLGAVLSGSATVGARTVLTITIVDDDSPPAAPTNLRVTPGDSRLDLAWDAPASVVTGYDVEYKKSTATSWSSVTRSGLTASQAISSLDNDSLYNVRVRAKNANGNSDWANGSGTPTAATGAVEVHLEVDQPRVREGAPLTLEVALTRGGASYNPQGMLHIPVKVTRDTAERGDLCHPYEQAFSVTVRISGGHGRSYGVVNLPTCHDGDLDDERFTVEVDEDRLPTGAVPYMLSTTRPTSATVTIDDDDDNNDRDPPGGRTVTLSVAPNPVPEGSTVTVTVTLQINGHPLASENNEVIPLRVHRLTSEPGDHGTLSSITIPGGGRDSGRTSASATIPTYRDGDRDHELFVVRLGQLPGHIGPGWCPSVRVTISEGGVIVLDPCTGLSVDVELDGLRLYP